MPPPGSELQHRVPSRAIVYFALVTFAITWSIIGGYIYFPDAAVTLFGEISGTHPLYFVATWAPAIAGVAVVFACSGRPGLRGFSWSRPRVTAASERLRNDADACTDMPRGRPASALRRRPRPTLVASAGAVGCSRRESRVQRPEHQRHSIGRPPSSSKDR